MMHFVHRGGDDDQTKQSVQPLRQRHIGMVKPDDGEHDDLVGNQFRQTNADQQNQRQAQHRGKCNLTEMKSAGCGHIHLGIRMMHAMKPPEDRNLMIQSTPHVRPAI
jgi:hypothetical protein